MEIPWLIGWLAGFRLRLFGGHIVPLGGIARHAFCLVLVGDLLIEAVDEAFELL
jgi:hypothetical protein